MLTKPLLFALLAACGVSNSSPEEQPIAPPDTDKPEEQHFCCSETWEKGGRNYGSDCVETSQGYTGTCRLGGGAVLYCSGSWQQDTKGTVSCK